MDHSPHVKTDLCVELPDLTCPQSPTDSIDRVLALDALEYFESKILYRLLDELARVCREGVVCDFVVPHVHGICGAGPFHRTT